MAVVIEVLLWLHIVAAIGWVGAAMVFGMLIGPALPTFTASTRNEFIVKVIPKYTRFAQVFTITTPVVGVALALSMSGGSLTAFAPTTQFGLFISAGSALALVAVVVAFGAVGPAAHGVVRLTEGQMNNPGPPSPELLAANKKLKAAASVGLVILMGVLVCMVAASI